MRVFPRAQHADAYLMSEALLKNGKLAPFRQAGYYLGIENEPLHFCLGESLVAVSTLLINDEMAEVFKLYVHPEALLKGIGLAAAQMSIDHLFNIYAVERVFAEILGDSREFWEQVADSYEDRAVIIESHCYFVPYGETAKNHFRWFFED